MTADETWRTLDRHARAGDPGAIQDRKRLAETFRPGVVPEDVIKCGRFIENCRSAYKLAHDDLKQFLRQTMPGSRASQAEAKAAGLMLTGLWRSRHGYPVSFTRDRGGVWVDIGSSFPFEIARFFLATKVLRYVSVQLGFCSPAWLAGKHASIFLPELHGAWKVRKENEKKKKPRWELNWQEGQ